MSTGDQDRIQLDLPREEAEALFRLAQDNLHERGLEVLDNRDQADAGAKALRKLAEKLTPKDYARSA